MRPILLSILLASLGCDSTGITGHADGSTDTAVDRRDATGEPPVASPYLVEAEKGECMDHVCPEDDPGAEFLETGWAGVSFPDCVVITHRCASFNCCTTLSAWIDHAGSVITLHERETGESCWCTCRYHAGYMICGLTPGSWDIRTDSSEVSARVTVPAP
ncbi:MAG: hypothetical protein JRG91_06075 [Deltaproteobacteria bacterium]|nr:hypothetical protein [Deltaproteobacteria bacterium]